jgi:K+-transporting ATPase A subunit
MRACVCVFELVCNGRKQTFVRRYDLFVHAAILAVGFFLCMKHASEQSLGRLHWSAQFFAMAVIMMILIVASNSSFTLT